MNKLIVAKNELKEHEYYGPNKTENRKKKNKRNRYKKAKKNKSKSKLCFLAFAFIMLLTCLFILNRYTKINRLKLEVSNLEEEAIELQKEKQALITELEDMKSANKIEADAIAKLGMDYPTDEQIVYLDVDESIFEDYTIEAKEGFNMVQYFKCIINKVVSLF